MLDRGIYGWTPSYVLLRPWIIVEETYLRIKWFLQRGFRGYCDRDVWDVGSAITRILIPMLKNLQKNKHGYPVGLSEKKWSEVLRKIIEGLEVNRRLGNLDYPRTWIKRNDPRLKKLSKTATEGLYLLGKHFNDLWD